MKWRLPLLASGCLALVWVALVVAGVHPWQAVLALVRGSVGSASAFSGTLRETTPLLIAGVAAFLALQAGLFNIGVEGQLVVGALACTYVALHVPGIPGVLLGTVAAIFAGSLWALPAGLIRAYRGGHEVITTIMLNSVATFITTALVAGPLKDPRQESPTTANLPEGSRLPFLYDDHFLRMSSGIIVGLVLITVFTFWLKRLVAGYELRAVGQNARAATLAGISPPRVIVRAMAISGGIAGLAGAVQVLGYEGRFYSDFSPGYGFSALGVALLAGSNPVGVVPAALLLGALNRGSASLQILGVPKGSSLVVLGILIVLFGAFRYRHLSHAMVEA